MFGYGFYVVDTVAKFTGAFNCIEQSPVVVTVAGPIELSVAVGVYVKAEHDSNQLLLFGEPFGHGHHLFQIIPLTLGFGKPDGDFAVIETVGTFGLEWRNQFTFYVT
jgi:hypothetical protein